MARTSCRSAPAGPISARWIRSWSPGPGCSWIRGPPRSSSRATWCWASRKGRFTESHVAGEIGQVVLGRAPGRRGAGEVTIFKSLGMAVEDVVAADLVLSRAVEQGSGAELSL